MKKGSPSSRERVERKKERAREAAAIARMYSVPFFPPFFVNTFPFFDLCVCTRARAESSNACPLSSLIISGRLWPVTYLLCVQRNTLCKYRYDMMMTLRGAKRMAACMYCMNKQARGCERKFVMLMRRWWEFVCVEFCDGSGEKSREWFCLTDDYV